MNNERSTLVFTWRTKHYSIEQKIVTFHQNMKNQYSKYLSIQLCQIMLSLNIIAEVEIIRIE